MLWFWHFFECLNVMHCATLKYKRSSYKRKKNVFFVSFRIPSSFFLQFCVHIQGNNSRCVEIESSAGDKLENYMNKNYMIRDYYCIRVNNEKYSEWAFNSIQNFFFCWDFRFLCHMKLCKSFIRAQCEYIWCICWLGLASVNNFWLELSTQSKTAKSQTICISYYDCRQITCFPAEAIILSRIKQFYGRYCNRKWRIKNGHFTPWVV